jgi:hypothetical protein
MLDQTSASPLTDELVPKGGAQPDLASRDSSDPADLPNTLDAPSGMLADIGSKQALPALVSRTLTPHRAARVLPVGILLSCSPSGSSPLQPSVYSSALVFSCSRSLRRQ